MAMDRGRKDHTDAFLQIRNLRIPLNDIVGGDKAEIEGLFECIQ